MGRSNLKPYHERVVVKLEDAPVTFEDSPVPCGHDPVKLGDSLQGPGVGLANGIYDSSRCRRAFLTGHDGSQRPGTGPVTVCDGP